MSRTTPHIHWFGKPSGKRDHQSSLRGDNGRSAEGRCCFQISNARAGRRQREVSTACSMPDRTGLCYLQEETQINQVELHQLMWYRPNCLPRFVRFEVFAAALVKFNASPTARKYRRCRSSIVAAPSIRCIEQIPIALDITRLCQ